VESANVDWIAIAIDFNWKSFKYREKIVIFLKIFHLYELNIKTKIVFLGIIAILFNDNFIQQCFL
jgi:hypothetical protein